jgi:type I restriction enzyme M protein
VLFVDYIAEHLSPAGRAAIIVPEGVIFQSGTAYKTLRKMLVEGNYLVGVISLPAGVFQPYSGVKTSILWIDRALARRSDKILFVKVENDGFDLGAQRRAIEKNDLPAALARPHIPVHPDWPMVAVGNVCDVNPKKSEVSNLDGMTEISFVPMSDIGENAMYFVPRQIKRLEEVTASYTYFRDGDVLIAKVTPCFENGKAGIARDLANGIGFGSSEFYVLRPSDTVVSEWLFLSVASLKFRAEATEMMTGTGGLQRVPRAVLEEFKIPLPPLATQQAIVAEIEAEQALVAGNRELITRFEAKIQATLALVWGEEDSTRVEG